jgi:hypothetical protein
VNKAGVNGLIWGHLAGLQRTFLASVGSGLERSLVRISPALLGRRFGTSVSVADRSQERPYEETCARRADDRLQPHHAVASTAMLRRDVVTLERIAPARIRNLVLLCAIVLSYQSCKFETSRGVGCRENKWTGGGHGFI